MNVIVLLAVILLVLMVLIGGKKGLHSFISIFLNFTVVLVALLFMLDPHVNLMILTLILCVVISCINLFYINGVNVKTITAFISTFITYTLLLLLIHMMTKYTMIQGFGDEEAEELGVFSLYIGIDFLEIGAAVILMSAIGAIIDVAISITSSMDEIFNCYPQLSKKELFLSGIEIGRDILGTDTNTLFFAFFGSYLGLLIWFQDLSYSFGEIMNSKVFASEMITIFCSGIGIALVIPITASINVHFLMRKAKKS
ncbi:MAG TPA: YibE/F family protein [Massilibacterium sp.]|nr:YibE/F family protein [Massilibacterium sp.]